MTSFFNTRSLVYSLYAYFILLILGLHHASPPVILAGVLFSIVCLRATWRGESVPVRRLFDRNLFRLLFVSSLLAWSGLIVVEYYSIEYSNFDTGIYANQVSIFNQTGRYFSSLLDMPALGEHFTPNLLLFSPLLSLVNSLFWFPFFKLFAFLLCPIILYQLGKEVLGSNSKLLFVAPILFLCNRYILSTVAMEFQPSGLAMPVILLCFLFAVRQQTTPLFACLIFLLGFKEHLSLIWISVGLFYIFELRRPVSGSVISSLGICFGLLVYFVLMPYFAEGLPNSHSQRFEPTALMFDKFKLIFKALFSVGFIPLLVPRLLPCVLAAFGIALVSKDPLMLTLSYHYQDIALTVLFVGVVYGLRKLQSLELNRHSRVALAAVAVALLFYHNRFPSRLIKKEWPSQAEISLVRELELKRQSLNRESTLWTLNSVGPYFFDFQKLRPIIHPEPPFHQDPASQVIIPTGVQTWPLSVEEVETMRAKRSG